MNYQPPTLVGFAEIAADCYNETNVVPGDLHGWKRESGQYGSKSDNNFYACAYHFGKTDLVAIGYRGTADRRDVGFAKAGRDVVLADVAGIGLSLNALSMNMQAAIDFAYDWSRRTRNIWLIGHSLGGAYVQVVAAIWNGMWGVTFNSPGAVHLVNQFSNHPLTKFAGSVCNPVMQIGMKLLLRELGSVDLVSYFSKVLAADNDLAFATVANYRAQNDPVSLLGVHVGAPVKVIQVDPALKKIHHMETIVEALGGRVYKPAPRDSSGHAFGVTAPSR